MTTNPSPPQAAAPGAAGQNWKTQTYLIGAVVGLLLGLLAAYLFARASEENNNSATPQKVRTSDMMKLTLSVLNLVRQVADIGARDG